MEELLQDELFAVISDDALCAANSRRSRIVENSTSIGLRFLIRRFKVVSTFYAICYGWFCK